MLVLIVGAAGGIVGISLPDGHLVVCFKNSL